MFARIMAVVIACIVLLTLSFGALSAVTVRNQQINARLEALTKEAREIAFLAANNQASSMALMFGYDDDIQKYIDWKSKNIWETYGAYILVVDRLGRVMDNLSLAMTSSYSTMLLTCSMIANIDHIDQDVPLIEEVAGAVEKSLEKYEGAIKELASRDFERAVFLGSGPLKGVAEECRLKLQELTDGAVMCSFDSFLGFRHGPKAVVKPNSLLVYLLSPNPKVRRYELDLIRQVKANNKVKGTLIISADDPSIEESYYDLGIITGMNPSMPPCYGCVSFAWMGQLLGFFKSLDLGLSPDSPSISGNISRVVEGVTLYN